MCWCGIKKKKKMKASSSADDAILNTTTSAMTMLLTASSSSSWRGDGLHQPITDDEGGSSMRFRSCYIVGSAVVVGIEWVMVVGGWFSLPNFIELGIQLRFQRAYNHPIPTMLSLGWIDRGEEGACRKPSLVDIDRVENVLGGTLRSMGWEYNNNMEESRQWDKRIGKKKAVAL